MMATEKWGGWGGCGYALGQCKDGKDDLGARDHSMPHAPSPASALSTEQGASPERTCSVRGQAGEPGTMP